MELEGGKMGWKKLGMDGMVGGRDQFPIGMRVLAVDDDPTCLKVLEHLLLRCRYKVTTTNQAVKALKLLRENKDMFDLVISDVHMPDMDGFKLLELVGLEMDLPVIMLSVNGETSAVMKGISHGACDYLLKPVRMEELKNIWQHVVRRRFVHGEKFDVDEEREKSRSIDADGGQGRKEARSSELAERFHGKRKELTNKDEDNNDHDVIENYELSAQKKPRVVWSVELHRKFVAAVNQLGIEKAVPKRILELMNVEKLTRENVASHLQKFRLYLKRLASHQAGLAVAFGGQDPSSYLHMGTFEGFDCFQNYCAVSAASSNMSDLASFQSSMVPSINGHSSPRSMAIKPGNDFGKFPTINLLGRQSLSASKGMFTSLDQGQIPQKWVPATCNNVPAVSSIVNTGDTACVHLLTDSAKSPVLSQQMQQKSKHGPTGTCIHLPAMEMQWKSSGAFHNSVGPSSSGPPDCVPVSNQPAIHSYSNKTVPETLPCFPVDISPEMLFANSLDSSRKRATKPEDWSAAGVATLVPSDICITDESRVMSFSTHCGKQKMDDGEKRNHAPNTKLLASSFQNSQVFGHDTNRQSNNPNFHQYAPYSDANTPVVVEPVSGERNALGAKEQAGLRSNMDGLLSCMIKTERELPFADANLACDLYPLGACI